MTGYVMPVIIMSNTVLLAVELQIICCFLNGTMLAETGSTRQQVFCLLLNHGIKTTSFRVLSAAILKLITSLVLSSVYFKTKPKC